MMMISGLCSIIAAGMFAPYRSGLSLVSYSQVRL
jgi:hypothetical protein